MDRRLRSLGQLGLVLAAAALAFGGVLGSATAASPAPGPAAFPMPEPASELPTALLGSPASRLGFNSAIADSTIDAAPAAGNLTTVLTFWPSSPSFYLTPGPGTPALTTAEVAAEYGLSPARYAALESYFVQHGLTILHAWPDRLFLTVTGPAAQMGAAFGTTERSGAYDGRAVVFATSVPSLPAPYQGEVAAASGLTTDLGRFTLPFEALPDPSTPLSTDSTPAQGRTTQTVTPTAIHTIYGLDALYNYSGSSHWATGVGIALLLWGDGYSPNDLSTFYSQDYPSEFPAPELRYFPVDGAPDPSSSALGDPSTGPQELTLDLEWAGSEAPGATLNAVYAPDGPASNGYSPTDQSMEDALNEAVTSVNGVQVLSMSFGTLDGTDTAFQAAFSTAFHEATLKGITILAASGDTGGTANKGCQGDVAPQFPAASPQVVAVGGTAPVLSENALGVVDGLDSEPAWNLSGGGFSSDYSAPAWQLVGSAAAPIRASGMRGMPDVAGPASDNEFYFNGRATFGEGTSFATPMWAGLVAEMDAVRGSSLGFVTPHLYAVGAAEGSSGTPGLVDITQGANCLGPAGPGWDTATGWGTPRALPLFEEIAGTYVVVNLSASPEPVAPGGTLTATIHAFNETSQKGLGALSVYVELDSLSYSGPCGGVLATATGATDANGSFTVGVPVPGCYFGTRVSLAVTVSANGYYGSNQTTVTVNLDGLSGVLAALQQYPYNLIGFAVIMAVATSVGLYASSRHKRRLLSRRPPAPPPGATAPAAPPTAPGPSAPTPSPGVASTGVPDSTSPEPMPSPKLDPPIDVVSTDVPTSPPPGS
jgi:kumamolisin